MQTLDAIVRAIATNEVDAAIMPASSARDLLASNQAKLVGWYSELDEIQFGALFASSKMIATRRAAIEKFVRAYRRGVTDYTEALLRKDRNSKRTGDIKSHEAATTIALWETAARTGETRDVYRDMRACSLRALTRAMFGTDVAGKTEGITNALDAIHAYVNPVSLMSLFNPPPIVRRLLTPGYSRFEKGLRHLNETFDEILRRRREGDTTAADLLGLFMIATDDEVAEVMSPGELHDEMMVILMAGHETTAVAAGWAWHWIARTP
jgi:cytochrome P450